MGHAIDYGFLNATTKEKALKEGYSKAVEFAYRNVDEQEDPSRSYDNVFKFYNERFDNEEEALAFFSEENYKDGVCLVKKPTPAMETRYLKKKTKIYNQRKEFIDKVVKKFTERTSATVGCKKCGNRITKENAIKTNLYCPSCGNWLVSDTVKARLKAIEEKEIRAEEAYKAEIKEKGKYAYYYKVEVHC